MTTEHSTPEQPRLLRFGYNRGIPSGVQTAWGCRAICTQDGTVDVVWGHTNAVGPQVETLLSYLTNLPLEGGWQHQARVMLRYGDINTREDREVVLWQDATVVIKANPQRSAGYLYVCAYLVAEVRP